MNELERLQSENAELRKEILRAEAFTKSVNKCWAVKVERLQLSLNGVLDTIRFQTKRLSELENK